MKNNINFSIIIPHKNIPDLLQRCLNSIPRREDIQIIIVDDNSDEDKVDFSKFPGLNDKYVEVYFTKEGKGAGYARNVGLEHAKGKWLLFADADDFFHKNLLDIMEKYKSSECDLVYFGMDSIYSDTLLPCNREGSVNKNLQKAVEGDVYSQEKIRYRFLYPSCKFIQTSLVRKYNIQFDEVPASNDTMFGVKVATFAQSVYFDTSIIYCLTYRNDSLVTSYKYECLKSRLLVSFQLYVFLRKIHKEQFAQLPTMHWLQIRHCSKWLFFSDFFVLIRNYSLLKIIQELFIIVLKKS
jgi:glycosyltransferase involved in cell wall biosynthesis